MSIFFSELKFRFFYFILFFFLYSFYSYFLTSHLFSYFTNFSIYFSNWADSYLAFIILISFLINIFTTTYLLFVFYLFFIPCFKFPFFYSLFFFLFFFSHLFFTLFFFFNLLSNDALSFFDIFADLGYNDSNTALNFLTCNISLFYDFYHVFFDSFLLLIIPFHFRIYFLLFTRDLSFLFFELFSFLKYFYFLFSFFKRRCLHC